jgi:hypothetical protein
MQNHFEECLPFRKWFTNNEWYSMWKVVKVTNDDVSIQTCLED